MLLNYYNKKSKEEILKNENDISLEKINDIESSNKLILGENLKVLKHLLYNLNLQNSIDLVYIDPPFATNSHFKIGTDRTSTISSSNSDETAYSDILIGSDFIEFIRERLILLRELLSDKGSIYLHIDYKIGHYVKIVMDEVFGVSNFRNDITRIKCNPKNFKRRAYGNIKDLILFYTKTDNYIWNEPKVELTEESIARLFKKIDSKGSKYTTIPLHAPGETQNGNTGKAWRGMLPPKGRHWRSDPMIFDELDKQGLIEWSSNGVPRKIVYADAQKEKGQKLQDIWEYKDPPYPVYPTQKNENLLDLIIKTSSNEGSLVMDCFAGSGTTILSAQRNRRNWIGVDSSNHSIDVIKESLNQLTVEEQNLYSPKINYELYSMVKQDIAITA